MNKKTIVCGVLASALALSVTLSGCDPLISTNNALDMKQTVATINISKAEDFGKEELDDYKAAVGTTTISKRELISYFLNVGYSYLNYFNNYEDLFNKLVSDLVDNAVMTQYSVMYLLKEKETASYTAADIMNDYNAEPTLAQKYEYVLGKDSVEVKLAEYSLRVAINSAIDSYEKKILEDEDEDKNEGSGTRSTPGGVEAEKEKFYPRLYNKEEGKYVKDDGTFTDKMDEAAIDYNIYTGYSGYELEKSGVYEKEDALDGTDPSTRKRAYEKFLSAVNGYNLIDVKNEKMKKVRDLQYVEDEYVNQLEQRIIYKYYEILESKQEDNLKDGAVDAQATYKYLDKVYNDALRYQKDNHKASGFTSTLDSMSDNSFILYAPAADDHGVYYPEGGVGKFGFVYNILLPFNAEQSVNLTKYKTLYADEDEDSGYTPDYFIMRNALLRDITTTDQREAWFNGSTEYAFDASESSLKYFGESGWLFFEKNLTEKDKYEELERYAGLYSYNGTVAKNEDDEYTLTPKQLTIDDMLKEFSDYIDFVLDPTGSKKGNVVFENGYTLENENTAYYGITDFYKAGQKEGGTKLDYSNFLYASGSVNGVKKSDNITEIHADFYDKTSTQYKVLSAVNELQYAYTTDTGVLSNYVGYSVNAADTNYIKEFEYAAQYAINKFGAGGFTVCAGDYGWHLIYVTYTFEPGDQFVPNWEANIDVEGSFENLFYEYVKSKNITDIESKRRSEILTQFNIDKTVKKYKKAYQDLLNLG